jgi:hypothetical protein
MATPRLENCSPVAPAPARDEREASQRTRELVPGSGLIRFHSTAEREGRLASQASGRVCLPPDLLGLLDFSAPSRHVSASNTSCRFGSVAAARHLRSNVLRWARLPASKALHSLTARVHPPRIVRKRTKKNRHLNGTIARRAAFKRWAPQGGTLLRWYPPSLCLWPWFLPEPGPLDR